MAWNTKYALVSACAAAALTLAACSTGAATTSGTPANAGTATTSPAAATTAPAAPITPVGTTAPGAATDTGSIAAQTTPASANSELSTLSPNALISRSEKALTGRDFRMVGTMTDSGDTTKLDITTVGGTVYAQITGAGLPFQVLLANGQMLVKFSTTMWKKFAGSNYKTVQTLVGDRWLLIPAGSSDAKGFKPFTDPATIAKEVLTPTGTPGLGKPTTVNAVPVLTLTDHNNNLYVAADDARPIQVTGSDSTGSGNITFSYDNLTVPAAPAASDIIDLSALNGSS